MEGLLSENRGYAVYNGFTVFDFFDRQNIKAVSLANNHVKDISKNYEYTIKELENQGIQHLAVGKSEDEARRLAALTKNSNKYTVLGFGRKGVGCRKNKNTDIYINLLEKKNIVQCIRNTKNQYPDYRIICFFIGIMN